MNDYLDFVFTKPISSLLLGLLLLVISLFLLGVPQSIAGTNWPTTEGVVVYSEIKESEGGIYDEGGWNSEVTYRYTVNQNEYMSNKIHYVDLGSSNTDSYARETTEKYPIGRKVMVYFNPDDPAQAILEPGPAGEAILPAAILMMMGVAPIAVCLVSRRCLRSARRGRIPGNGSEPTRSI